MRRILAPLAAVLLGVLALCAVALGAPLTSTAGDVRTRLATPAAVTSTVLTSASRSQVVAVPVAKTSWQLLHGNTTHAPACGGDDDYDAETYYSCLALVPSLMVGATVLSRNYLQKDKRAPMINVAMVWFHTLDVMTDAAFYTVALTSQRFECLYGDYASVLQTVCLASIMLSALIWFARSCVMELLGVGATGLSDKSLNENKTKIDRLLTAYNNKQKREQNEESAGMSSSTPRGGLTSREFNAVLERSVQVVNTLNVKSTLPRREKSVANAVIIAAKSPDDEQELDTFLKEHSVSRDDASDLCKACKKDTTGRNRGLRAYTQRRDKEETQRTQSTQGHGFHRGVC